MSRRNHNRVDLQISKLSRRRQVRRSQVLCEALEKRRLLSGYTGYTFTLAAQPGTNQAAINLANGTYLQGLINGTKTITGDGQTNHTITLGDTLILPDTYDYDMGTGELKLPNLGAAATATESSGAVTSLSLTFAPAGGYTAAPTVSIFGGGGSGATGTVTYNSTSGTVTGISLTNGGSGYTAAPSVAIQGGAETLTIESGGFNAGDISGRFNAASDVPYDAQISCSGIDSIVLTEDPTVEDAYGHLGAAQNYTFDGIEVCPDAATDGLQSALVNIGTDIATQDYDQLASNNFTFNQDYIHGGALGQTSDDLNTAALETTVAKGLVLDANYVTVENSQISDIHSASNNGGGVETHAISGANLLGNFTINNNYLEATGEGIIFGGAENYLPDPAQANNISITNNYITKNPAWNPALPQYAGVPMVVKNDIELKTGTNVTISHNILENVWVGADQRGQAINLSNLDTYKMDPWYNDANITITDNVFRNVGRIIDISAGEGDTVYPPSQGDAGYTGLTNNITIENNLAYDIGGWQWAYDNGSGDDAITMDSGTGGPMYNITIENNTFIGTDGIMYLEGPSGLTGPVADNLVCENNVLDESVYGIASSAGTDNGTLNSVEIAALTITNPGSGYTAAPTVTLSGGGGSGATATAYVWPQTEGGLACPFAGQLMYVQITNYGSGYTANPTVTFNNTGTGGSGGAASATAESDDQIHGYTFTHNLIIGGSSSNYPAGNYFPATENAVEMLDPAGDEYGILSTSPYYADGTGGSIPGVNMANLDVPDFTPLDSSAGLVALWKFDEGSGSTATPVVLSGSGSTLAGTLGSAVTWTTSGDEDDALTFPGGTNTNTGCVTLANQPALPTNLTLMAWIDPENNSGNVSGIVADGFPEFAMWIDGSGHLNAEVANVQITDSSFDYYTNANQWYLVGVTFNSSTHTMTLYRDGQPTDSASDTGTISSGGVPFKIGAANGGIFYGSIDDVYMYNTALSGTEHVIGDNNLGLAGGSGYNTTTNGTAVTFSGGGGSGAAATAYAENTDGVITSIIITNSGSGYTSAPTMSFGSTGTGAADTAAMSVTPISYLYAQYGPQFAETTAGGESDIVKGTTTTLSTDVVTPDEVYSAATYDWSVVTWPSGAGVAKPSLSGSTNGSTVTFKGAGSYLFQCVVTNSVGQSATVDYPVTVLPVSSTNVAFISPSSVTVATNGMQTFTVNGTSIANLGNTITDQFGNPMPSAGWAWAVSEAEYGTITNPSGTNSGGLYTAPNHAWGEINNCISLGYTTPDGVLYYNESTADVDITGSTPNVPTSVTATSSGTATSIAVKWSESSTGSIDYNIQRSTNGTSGWSTVASGLTNTSYTDSSSVAGTTYYYEVDAYYPPSGTPSAWSSSANAATMAAYEGFAYTTGNGQKWQGANGGLGWSTAWSLSGTNDTSIVAGLSYTSGSSALTTSGNAAQIVADSTAIRSLSSTVGTAGSTLWISAEMNLHEGNTLGTVLGAEIDLGVYSGSTANDVRLGAPNSNGDIGAAVDIYPYANSVSTSTSIVANTTYFVVYEIQYLTTGDVISIYEDPTLVTQPASASAVLTLPSTQQLKSTTELTLNSNEIYTYSQWDELRLGPTYASVTPDPLITNSNKKSSHSHKSSPFLSGAAATGKSSEILSASKPASANLNYFYAALSGGSWRWANSALDDDNLLTAAPNDINGSWQGLFN